MEDFAPSKPLVFEFFKRLNPISNYEISGAKNEAGNTIWRC